MGISDADRWCFGQGVRFGQNVVKTGIVTIGRESSVWHNVVLRGDVMPITIGEYCNIQDNTVIHGQLGRWATTIGDRVSVGHSCLLHGCELAADSFVGMGAILLNGSYIGSGVLVAAGSLIPEGKRFEESNTLVMGRPGKVVRHLNEREKKMISETVTHYLEYAKKWLSPIKR